MVSAKARVGFVGLAMLCLPQLAGGFDRSEVECEDAVAHIARCCPESAAPNYACDHYTGCGRTRLPEILGADSACVRSLSCEEVVADGWCTADDLVQGRCS